MPGLLSEDKWFILNFALELDRRIQHLKNKLTDLPKGHIDSRQVNDKVFYRYIERINGRQVEKRLCLAEYDKVKRQLDDKILYKEDIVLMQKCIKANIKTYARVLHYAEEIINNYYSRPNTIFNENNYKPEGLLMNSISGIKVRSKSEMLIINSLENHHLKYEYEHELKLSGFTNIWHPDFWIYEPLSGKIYIWEHSGMYSQKYELYMENKLNAYKLNGITEGKNLILTKDEKDGSIDMQKIEEIINRVFFLAEYRSILNKYE